jgi:hypothetical protein
MFLLGAAKNLRAQNLISAVEELLDVIRSMVNVECLVDATITVESHCIERFQQGAIRAARHSALIAAARSVRVQFDRLENDVRGTIPIIPRLKEIHLSVLSMSDERSCRNFNSDLTCSFNEIDCEMCIHQSADG